MLKKALENYLHLLKHAIDVEDWVHENIAEKLKKIPSVKKDTRLVDFREPVNLQEALTGLTPQEAEFKDDYVKNIVDIQSALRRMQILFSLPYVLEYENARSVKSNIQKYIDFIEEFLGLEAFDSAFIKNRVAVGGSTIKLTKLYEQSISILAKSIDVVKKVEANLDSIKYLKEKSVIKHTSDVVEVWFSKIKKLKDLNNLVDWENRIPIEQRVAKSYEVVFSTKHKDIYGMSSRSDWGSCQKCVKNFDLSSLAIGVVGSCVAKNVGVIYVTDGSDYAGRGERMYRRCVVWLIRKFNSDKELLLLQKMYPKFDINLANIFKDILERKLGMPALVGEALQVEDWDKYFREIGEEEVELQSPSPYKDVPIWDSLSIKARFRKVLNYVLKDAFVDLSYELYSITSYNKQFRDIIKKSLVKVFEQIINDKHDIIVRTVGIDINEPFTDHEFNEILEALTKEIKNSNIYKDLFVETALDMILDEITDLDNSPEEIKGKLIKFINSSGSSNIT